MLQRVVSVIGVGGQLIQRVVSVIGVAIDTALPSEDPVSDLMNNGNTAT